jgi:hypothetical protein
VAQAFVLVELLLQLKTILLGLLRLTALLIELLLAVFNFSLKVSYLL